MNSPPAPRAAPQFSLPEAAQELRQVSWERTPQATGPTLAPRPAGAAGRCAGPAPQVRRPGGGATSGTAAGRGGAWRWGAAVDPVTAAPPEARGDPPVPRATSRAMAPRPPRAQLGPPPARD